jgi:hypothetical protein
MSYYRSLCEQVIFDFPTTNRTWVPRTNMCQVTQFGLRVARSVDLMLRLAFIFCLFGRGLHIFVVIRTEMLLLVGAGTFETAEASRSDEIIFRSFVNAPY